MADKDPSLRKRLRVLVHDGRVDLTGIDANSRLGLKRKEAEAMAWSEATALGQLQEKMYATKERSLLIVLQGMDTGGKDGAIKHAMSGLNPQGVRVASFKAPTPEELRHDFLWRIRAQVPRPGEVVIFNRSHYEDVVVGMVHQLATPAVIEQRYRKINAFEKQLAAAGTTIIKFYMHISYDEQRERLLERLRNPDKRWKFSKNDLPERRRWPEYIHAYEVALGRCDSDVAPWYVVPANHKWLRNWVVSRLLVESLAATHPRYPRPKLNVRAMEAELMRGTVQLPQIKA
ncbi:MAG: PPK2 family polyphosphate kinase [Candidatus Dormibacteria bacterium]